MYEILENCNQQLKTLPCCHKNPVKEKCNCYDCLVDGFYADADSYDCFKKLNYYVINYGPSYSSEVYHYLTTSKILEKNFNYKKIRILSLGCGFAPDFIAIEKYIEDNNLNVEIEYTGIDQSRHWKKIRKQSPNCKFKEKNLLDGFNLSDYDIVFIVKVFSTLKKSNLHNDFLTVLKDEVSNSLPESSFLIFNDINHIRMGRDKFHREMNGLFTSYRQFYCDSPDYKESGWKKISQRNIIYSLPDNLKISPIQNLTKTVFFEYKK